MTTKNLLHRAVRRRNVDAVKFLLGEDYNVNDEDALGRTPLHTAFDIHRSIRDVDTDTPDTTVSDMVQIFLDHPKTDFHVQDKMGRTPIMAAIQNKYTHINVLDLLDKSDIVLRDNEDRNVLFYSILYNNYTIAKFCFQNGLRDYADKHYISTQMVAEANGYDDVLMLIREREEEIAKLEREEEIAKLEREEENPPF